MVYPHSFHRIVIEGGLYTERWATSFAMYGADLGASTADLLDDVKDDVQAWFSNTAGDGATFIASCTLDSVKVNRIAPNGLYQDPTSFTHFYSPAIAGPSASHGAPQLTGVVTLRTAFDRGRASRGRMYLPPAVGWTAPGSDGRVTGAAATAHANGIVNLFNSVHATYGEHYGGGDFAGGPVVESNIGTGAWHAVTDVQCGRVIDTMRSRRTSLDEAHLSATKTINW